MGVKRSGTKEETLAASKSILRRAAGKSATPDNKPYTGTTGGSSQRAGIYDDKPSESNFEEEISSKRKKKTRTSFAGSSDRVGYGGNINLG